MIKLLYFARLREALGTSQEELAIPEGVSDVQSLMGWLAQRGGAWQEEFTGCRPLRAAVNQELVVNSTSFRDGDEIWIEPFRAAAFPVMKDLITDRNAFDRIIQAGGYVSANTGSAPDGNAILIPKPDQDRAMDAAECIACGACVAACPNASAMLFVSAKVSHLGLLPQGQPERYTRVRNMVDRMDDEGFGNCSNHYECEAACPKDIRRDVIAELNRDFARSSFVARERVHKADGAG